MKCDRCKRPTTTPLTLGGRNYCGGHCVAIVQLERGEKLLAISREITATEDDAREK